MEIYVACLASYNAGILHGEWIDLEAADAGQLRDSIARILRASPCPNVTVTCPGCNGSGQSGFAPRPSCPACAGKGAVPSSEEWAAHDYHDVPGDWGEHPDIDKLCAFTGLLSELEDTEREAFIAYRDSESRDDISLDEFRDAYAGQFDSWADFAEDCVESAGLLQDVPATLSRYFDYESYGRDMRLGGDAYEASGFFFWNH